MDKIRELKKEISYIKNDRYRKNAELLVNILPSYFFKVPASSTGKYHPASSLGDGGLLRHTKIVVRIGYELLYRNNTFGISFSDDEKDLIIISLIMHDGLKHGIIESEYTVFEHPLIMAKYIRNNKDKLSLTDEEINFICDNIKTHMGQWTTDYKGNKVLEEPINKYQKIVHLCDFLASRKCMDIKFVNDEIID
ncbi:MAG: HD domain-containing protein [Bacilli bacterium]|nr:HD domain-containing protein [Bacilli bacterium]